MNNLYNEQLKEAFLKTYDNEQSRNTIKYLFFKAYPMELILEKDLYNFSKDEIGKVIQNADPMSQSVAYSYGRFIVAYLNWAIENGYRMNNINPLQGVTNEWYEQFIDKSKKVHFTDKEIQEIIDQLVNAQDAVILALLFEGVNGYGASEISNLKYKDVDFENGILKLYDDKKGERKIQVSNNTLKLIEKAYHETEYYSRNGEIENAKYAKTPVLKSEYVVKNIKRGRAIEGRRVEKHGIYRRIEMISELFNLPYLTPKGIQRSGMIYMAKELYLKNGKLGKEELSQIGEKFDFIKIHSQGYEYYNTTLMKEFINRDNILELYNIDIGE